MTTSSAMIINCSFYFGSFSESLSEVYTCRAAGISLTNNMLVIEGVSGNHLDGRENSDVLGFVSEIPMSGSNVMPRNLNGSFPNLLAIVWKHYNLKAISAEDLKPWPRLDVLALTHNSLTSLHSDVFKNSQRLQLIDLDFNNISNVGADLLSGLNNLKTFSFQYNVCDDFTATTPQEIQELSKRLEENCNADFTTETPPRTTDDTKECCLDSSITADILLIRTEVNDITEALKEIDQLRNEVKTLREQMSDVELLRTELKESVENIITMKNNITVISEIMNECQCNVQSMF